MNKINLEYLNELGGGDMEFVVEMLQTYIEETSKDMEALGLALEQSDLKRISFLAHRSKAAFKMLGLNSLSEAAEKLEQQAKTETVLTDALTQNINFIRTHAADSFVQAEKLIAGL